MKFTVVSGGQTGVDRAALEAALNTGVPIAGWCPHGRLAEDGMVPHRYPLIETPSESYEQRTEWNVRDSDATLIFTVGLPTGGTALTIELAARHDKPTQIVQPGTEDYWEAASRIVKWLIDEEVSTLNVGGPRESKYPGVYGHAHAFMLILLEQVRQA